MYPTKTNTKGLPFGLVFVEIHQTMLSPQAPQVGDLVRYYSNGWRHGHVIEVKPRKKIAKIKPCGPGRAVMVSLANVEDVE